MRVFFVWLATYAGLCGSGLISIISELFRTGAINSKGRFVRQSHRIRYDEYGGTYIIAFEDESMPHDILFTATFGGGKDIYQGWTLKVEQGTSGVNAIRTTPGDKNAPRYNMAGQRVANDYRGLVIQNGRKMMVK